MTTTPLPRPLLAATGLLGQVLRRLLWRGPRRLWIRPCKNLACQFSKPDEHSAHLTALSNLALADGLRRG